MTVCIAALAAHEKEMVLISDRKVSFGDFSSDRAAMKTEPFIPNYSLLFAGNDVSRAGVIIRRARKVCVVGRLTDPDEIAEVIYAECQRELNKIIEAKILSRHGFTTATFNKSGKRQCTEAVYYELSSKIDRVSLSLKFLLCGFDTEGHGHIRYIDTQGPPQDYDALGFYAIGTGGNAALSSLCHSVEHLHLGRDVSSALVAYHCIAAKFMAESASDVGQDTFVSFEKKDSQARFITPLYGMDYLRKQWVKHGSPRVPRGIESAITDLTMTVMESLRAGGIQKAVKYSPNKLRSLKGHKGLGPSQPKLLDSQKSPGQQ